MVAHGPPDRAAPRQAIRPLDAKEFADRLDPLLAGDGAIAGLALAVSGGADSMALALLARAWGRVRRRRIVALTVDHGLRPESARETAQVRAWLRARGVEHHILRWRGAKPVSNRQATARAARYALLSSWCRRHGVRHLALAHQLEDQAETFLLRAGRGSGVDGLAAMAPRRAAHGLILLRPLLGVARARLEAHLESVGQTWIEDPSNRDPAYARTRVRLALAMLAPHGLAARRFADTAGRMARVRAALEAASDALIALAVTPHEAGYCLVAAKALVAAPEEIALRALARVLMAVAGADLPPRLVRLERLLDAIRGATAGRGKTLLGCRILHWGDGLLVCREAVAAAPALALRPGLAQVWDGRFRVMVKRSAIKGLRVAALGDAWRGPDTDSAASIWANLPVPARSSLPALWHRGRVVALPAIGWIGPGRAAKNAGFRAEFAPMRPLIGPSKR